MRKSVLFVIVAMVALMLWSPILAEAKGDKKCRGKKKGNIACLQEQIVNIKDDVYNIQTDLSSNYEDIALLKDKVGRIITHVKVIEERLDSLSPAGESSLYSNVTPEADRRVDVELLEFPNLPPPSIAFETTCSNDDDILLGGGYVLQHDDLLYDGPEPTIRSGANADSSGWTAVIISFPVSINATLEVTAVCFAQ